MDYNTIKEGFVGQKMVVMPRDVRKMLRANPITSNFHITDLGYYPRAMHHYRRRKKGTNEFILIYCTEGKGWFETEAHRTDIHPNQYFILPKNTMHSYGANEDDPWSIYWVHFDGKTGDAVYKRYISNTKRKELLPFNNNRIDLFDQIFRNLSTSYIAPQMEYANILGLNLISSFVFENVHKSVRIANDQNLVESIIDFLTKNLNTTFKSHDIAKEFGYSQSYIFSLFKKRTGYSLIHFFNLKKIQKACEYLSYTDLSIKEISYRVGFCDALYFSRVFKKHMGVSPKAYKGTIS